MGDDVTDHDQTSGDGLHPDELPAHENWIARNSKTISTLATVAIPVVIAVVGTIANININNQNNDRQYVQLSYNILSGNQPVVAEQDGCVEKVKTARAENAPVDDIEALRDALRDELSAVSADGVVSLPTVALRNYALDLLVATTPVELSVDQYVALLCGKVNLPVAAADPGTDGPTIAADANGGAAAETDPGRFADVIAARQSVFDLLETDEEKLPSGCQVNVLVEAPTLAGTVVLGRLDAELRRDGEPQFVKVVTPEGNSEWMALSVPDVLLVDCFEQD